MGPLLHSDGTLRTIVELELINSERITGLAMQDSAWHPHAEPQSADARARFREQLKIERIPDTSLIEIRFTHASAEAAQAGVGVMVRAYERLHEERMRRSRGGLMQVLEERRTSTQTELTRIRNTIYEIAGSLGPDGVRQQHAALLQEFREYEVSIKHTILALAEEGVQVPIGDASEESEVNDSAGAAAPATSVAKLRNRLKQFRAFHEQTKDALTDMTRKKLLIENLEEDAAGAKKNLALVKQRIDALNLESRFSRIEVISDGGEPVPVSETRRRGREQSRSCS